MTIHSDLVLPSIGDIVAMGHVERLALLEKLDVVADQLAEVRGALRTLLHEPPIPAPLVDAKEAARRLGMSVDWVREHGRELDIEVWLTADPDKPVVRYDPVRVEALRQRRRPQPIDPIRARLNGIA